MTSIANRHVDGFGFERGAIPWPSRHEYPRPLYPELAEGALVTLVALTAALRAGAFIFCPLFRRPLVDVSLRVP